KRKRRREKLAVYDVKKGCLSIGYPLYGSHLPRIGLDRVAWSEKSSGTVETGGASDWFIGGAGIGKKSTFTMGDWRRSRRFGLETGRKEDRGEGTSAGPQQGGGEGGDGVTIPVIEHLSLGNTTGGT
ncbi:uncharacterized protein TRIREDRAFT_111579, partial [Trichoderma reesei QM6a]